MNEISLLVQWAPDALQSIDMLLILQGVTGSIIFSASFHPQLGLEISTGHL